MTLVLKIFISGFTSDGTSAICVGFIAGGGTFVAAIRVFPSIAGSFGSMDEDLEVLVGVFGYKKKGQCFRHFVVLILLLKTLLLFC